ncbi:GMC oxidoreductase-domain-containing protein [Staphylotrichum tortipilum]|uniref:Long-chain-alcohol oxidase n=1 Tax=Staphylotrichum tortipilum TaxID=2831512 RepID=A0AAN6MED7_9PEZI|nr:GMC oxidoreductase-domain-containing protein [Staphylotrichum longicolle]
MATATEAAAPALAPVPVSLPNADEFLTDAQWNVLMAIMDTVIPSIRIQETTKGAAQDLGTIYLPSDEYSEAAIKLRNASSPLNHSSDVLEAYLAERPSDNPFFTQLLKCVLSNVPPSKKRDMRILFSILNTRAGSLLLTSYATPLPSLPVADRAKILQSWAASPLFALRSLFKSMTTLGKLAHVRSSATFAPLTGFPAVPAAWTPGEKSYQYEFVQFEQGSEGASPVEIATDVVILGSGCGAGVVANRLAAEFGGAVSVLVLEKGRHLDASHYPMPQTTGLSTLFEAGGVVETDDGSMTVTAGSCFGGGGTVNWSAALQTQDFVRKEWAEARGLPFFEGEEFQNCLDRVCEKMGVTGEIDPNHANRVLLEGGKALGYTAKIVPQNVRKEKHNCGYCTLGCWKGEKMGPVNGWFPEAAEEGVKFAEGFKVGKVLFEQKKGKKVASGVEGVWTSKAGSTVQVVVKAKKVVVSCGTLWSPVVLINSGLKNPQIGKNLYLHPTNFVSGVFDEDIQPWEGGSLTSVVGSFDNLDSKGHGVKLEAMSMMPSFCMSFLPWASGPEYKLLSAKFRHLNTFIAICRDRETGHIYRDPTTGSPRIAYTPSDFDRAHNLRGVLELCKILFSQRAREIHPAIAGIAPFVRRDGRDEAMEKKDFDKWLAKVKATGNKPPVTPFASAHQMGTCRMSAKPKEGVVDPKGRVWGTEGLYVADASVFPSASGVNPMVTTMAVSDWIAQGLCEDLRGEGIAARL